MEAPSLILVPPSSNFPNPSPSSSVPELTQSPIDQERSSSETTIFTIYSMYGDDDARASWSASAFDDNSKELDLSLSDNFSYHNSFLKASPHTSTLTSDTTYIDLSSDVQPFSKLSSPHELARDSATSNGSAHLPPSRPGSNYATSLNINGKDSLVLPPRDSASAMQKRPRGTMASYGSSATDSIPPSLAHPISPRSRPPSALRRSESPGGERALTITPPQSSLPHGVPLTPQSPSSSPTKQRSKLSSPSSKTSLVPSEGEDLDAFHVRSTYAQLELTGVKGDGYEEGVERTRARVNASRLSELRAEEALADRSEKTRDLSMQEIRTLSSLDRYGFFVSSLHDRLVQLPSLPFSKRLTRVTAGPKGAPANALSLDALPAIPSPLKEKSRIAKWGRMLEVRSRDKGGNVETWGINVSKERKLRERVYKGIPDRWRGAVWEILMNRISQSGHKELGQLENAYWEELEKASTYDIQIDLDVPRTINGHILFRTRYGSGQRSLFRVLHAFSLRCSHCGYVQGMGPIAATFLCYFQPERVYASLVRLHDSYLMHTIFSPGFPGLLEAIYVQERTIEFMMPDVYGAFKEHTISTTSYATKWYITLFANSVPFQTQLRLWDAYLLDGQDVFVAVAVAIVWVYRDQITSSSASFETVLSLLSSFFVPEDEDSLLFWIENMLGDKKLRSRMDQWRTDWKQLVATGQDSKALL